MKDSITGKEEEDGEEDTGDGEEITITEEDITDITITEETDTITEEDTITKETTTDGTKRSLFSQKIMNFFVYENFKKGFNF